MRRATFVVLSVLAACTEPPAAPPNLDVGPPSVRPAGTEPQQPILMDDAFHAFGQSHPGFGGLWMRQDGTLVAGFMGAPTATRDEIARLALDVFGPPARSRRIEFESAAYPFALLYNELKRLVALARPEWLSRFGIDESRGKLTIGAVDEKARKELAAILDPRVPAEIAVEGRVEADQGLSGFYRPLLGGSRAFAPGGCSLGGNASTVTFSDPNWWGAPQYVLTAAHCTSAFGGVTPSNLFQPTSDLAAVEIADPGFLTRGSIGDWRCPSVTQPLCRYSDVAVFLTVGGGVPAYPYPAVAATPNADPSVVSFAWTMIQQWQTPPMGLGVVKTGATTGSTFGVVERTCETVSFLGRWLICVSGAVYGSDGGDSGGAVVGGGVGTQNYHAGIHFGRNSVTGMRWFSPHANITSDFFLNPIQGVLITYTCPNGGTSC